MPLNVTNTTEVISLVPDVVKPDTKLSACESILDSALDLLWPKRCVGCERLGGLLCAGCEAQLPIINQEQACPRCGAPYGRLICTECYGIEGSLSLSFSAATSAFLFEETAARLVVIYKDQHEQRLAALIATALARVIAPSWIAWADLLSYVPASQDKLRERGFCHMQLVARQLGELTGLEQRELLHKMAGEDQRKLNREQRLGNLSRALVCSDPRAVQGRNILLIDDVMTTTATLQAAALVLRDAGAREVRVVTLCRVY